MAAYIKARANVEPRKEVLDRIFEETEGNAFFLSEVVNLMAQEGTLTKTSISDIAIPDGVREALGRRLNRLTEETNELLQIGAIIGRDFTYDTLTLLGDRDEDALLKMIEEALEARVIEETEQAGRYRFTHAQMQETLLAELSTTRRVRLHGQVGEALEKRYGAHADERAARLRCTSAKPRRSRRDSARRPPTTQRSPDARRSNSRRIPRRRATSAPPSLPARVRRSTTTWRSCYSTMPGRHTQPPTAVRDGAPSGRPSTTTRGPAMLNAPRKQLG